MDSVRTALWRSVCGFAVIAAAPAAAQETAEETGLADIVVTAQKREQSIQDVPIAVSAFDSRTLEQTRTSDVRDLAERTPNLVTTNFNVAEPRYAVRGIGSTSDSAASDPSVAVFVDEVYMGRPAISNFDLFDLERIEVLRGPQGTLFGRNTSGGAISVITARPQIDRSFGRAQGSIGNKGVYEARVVANAGNDRNFAARIGGAWTGHGAFSRNIVNGGRLDYAQNMTVRGQLLFEPSDRLTILWGADFVNDDNGGNARIPYPVIPTTATAPLIRRLYPAGASPRLSFADPRTFQKREAWGTNLRLEFDAGFAELVSITSYREADINQHEDLNGLSPSPPWVLVNQDYVRESSNQFTQELRLVSQADSSVDWVAGLYYFRENVDRNERFFTRFLPLPAAGGDVTFLQDVRSTSYAAFAQATVPLVGGLRATGGLRYTHDRKRMISSAINNDPADPVPGIPLFPGTPYSNELGRDSWGQLTGKGSLEYKFGDNLLYASVSRGYKSGVFASQANNVNDVRNALPPEKVWAYEAGTKLTLLGNRLRFNVAGFYYDYTDLQQFLLNAQLRLVTFNVDARVKGVEAEATAAVTDWLTVGGTGALLDTKIKASNVGGINLNGRRLPQAPKRSYSLFASTRFDLGSMALSARVDYSYRSSFFTEPTNLPETRVPGYGLVNARAALSFADDRYEIAVWGKNLSNKLYQVHVIPFLGNGFSVFGDPRTYGVTLTARFE